MLPHNSAHAAAAACTSIAITLIPAIVNGYCQNFRPIAKTWQWLLHIVHFRAASLLADTLFPLCPQSVPSRRSNLPTPQTLQLPRHSSRTIWNDIVPKLLTTKGQSLLSSRTIWNDIVPKPHTDETGQTGSSRTIWNDIVPKPLGRLSRLPGCSRTIWNDIVPKLSRQRHPLHRRSRTIWNDIVPKRRVRHFFRRWRSRTIWNDIVPKPQIHEVGTFRS